MAERIAVIGAGVSGLTAAYILREQAEVTLFEKDARLGGHAHTHSIVDPAGDLRVDSGFIVHNERTYPYLLRLFRELEVETQATEMSMSISCGGCGLEYAGGRGLRGILAQPWRVFDPRFIRMLVQVPRFHRQARELLADAESQLTWGEFLKVGKFNDYFIRHFAIPLVSCVWSSGDQDAMAYPARHLFAFLNHHGMLSVGGSPTWRTVVGGSRSYVDALVAKLADVRAANAITSVRRGVKSVELTTETGQVLEFDRVVLATHADDALALLADASDQERADLAAITYSANQTVLHTDAKQLPRTKQARASWNYRISSCAAAVDSVLVTYWMNKLQRLSAANDYLVTLNPGNEVAAESVLATMSYAHPVFTHEAVNAAARLRSSGGSRLAFAGAHLGWGFHEDGARSGVEAAAKFGVQW